MTVPIWPITSDAFNDLSIPGRSWCRIAADFRRSDFYQYFCWFSVDELNVICADVIDLEVEVKNTPTSIECDAGSCHYTVKFLGNVSSGMIRRIRGALLALLTDDRLVDFNATSQDGGAEQ